MKLEELKSLAQRLGVVEGLDRLSRWRAGAVLRLWLERGLANWGSRQRRDLRLIGEDFRFAREQIEGLSQGVPQGDPGKAALLVSSFPTVWGIKLEGVLSLALRLKDYSIRVVEVTDQRWQRWYHRAYGNHDFVNLKEFRLLNHNSFNGLALQPPRDLSVRKLMKLNYRGVDIGRIILSNVMYRYKFERFDPTQPHIQAEIRHNLAKVQRHVLAAEMLVDRLRPAMALVLEKGLSPAAEIVGVCLNRGIPVVQYLNSQDMNGFVLKRFSLKNRQNHPFSLDPGTWERVRAMPWSPAQEEEMLRDLEASYRSGTWFNRKFLHDGKRIKTPEEVKTQLGLNPAKKTAVIFSHVLWDATFFYGDNLFEDYETWLIETVRAACANPMVNWVVKIHPDLAWKLKFVGYKGELRDLIAMRTSLGTLPDNVKIVLPDTDISTYSFFQITDYCLTVRGTIGIEMACYGVPVLTAGTGRYSHLDFTVDSASKAEYLERLAHIQDLPPMSREQVELARRFAYALFKLRPWKLASFETVKMPMEQTGHPLEQNLAAHVADAAQFRAAEDLRSFMDWIDSGQIDYLAGP